jgi:hypothetical protein
VGPGLAPSVGPSGSGSKSGYGSGCGSGCGSGSGYGSGSGSGCGYLTLGSFCALPLVWERYCSLHHLRKIPPFVGSKYRCASIVPFYTILHDKRVNAERKQQACGADCRPVRGSSGSTLRLVAAVPRRVMSFYRVGSPVPVLLVFNIVSDIRDSEIQYRIRKLYSYSYLRGSYEIEADLTTQ